MARCFYSALLLLIAGLFITGCEIANEEDNTKSFLIVDQSDNKVLNNYEYSKDSNTLVRTESYTPDQKVKKSIEYEYDSSGNLTRTTEKSIGYPIKINHGSYLIDHLYETVYFKDIKHFQIVITLFSFECKINRPADVIKPGI